MALDSTRAASPGSPVDQRWQQWIAKGHAHDRQVRDQARSIAFALFAVVAFLLAARLGLE